MVETAEPLEVVLCGPSAVLKKFDPKQLRIVVDAEDLQPVHNQKIGVRIECDNEAVWAYYNDSGYKIEISITQE